MEHDRRRHIRYRKADLEVDVAKPGIKGMLTISPSSQCLDFCLAGLRFESDQAFEPGETLFLDLRVYGVAVREIKARVISCVPHERHYCVGVRFCFEEKSMQRPEISHGLLHIEDRLRTAQAFPINVPASNGN